MEKKNLLKILVAVFSIVLALKFSFIIAEVFFFDKFFYQKSATYGYVKQLWNPLTNKQNPQIIEDRLADLRLLVNNSQTSSVLGIQSDQNEYKIAIIGDSMVYGLGIKSNDRFSVKLEEKLSKIRKTKVYNLAQSGDGILDNYAKFKLAKQFYHPNMYIIGIVDNDLVFDSLDKYPQEIELFNEIKPTCPGPEFMSFPVPSGTIYESLVELQNYPSFSAQYSNICILKESIKKMLEPDANVLFFAFRDIPKQSVPNPSTPAEKALAVMQIYVNTIQSVGGSVLDVNPGYAWFTPVSKKEGHPSAEANKLFAEIITKEILENPKWKFSN